MSIATRVADRVTEAAPVSDNIPICVDLDGTLVRSDTLIDILMSGMGNWRVWHALTMVLTHGRAGMKRELARVAPIDAASLPYNEDLLRYLRAEKARGRKLILATAADQIIADAVGAHLQIFDEVLASDGENNLKGARKRALLVERFGEKGFVYAGNDRADLDVWRSANAAIVVNAPRSVANAVTKEIPVEKHVKDVRSPVLAAVKALRPYQWVKNLLVLVPIATAHSLDDRTAWIEAGWAFAAFCATASSIYLINDLLDLKADRLHPRKRNRAFASGVLSPIVGLFMFAALLIAGTFFAMQTNAFALVGLYAVVSLSYSLWLKEFPLVDIFVLAGLYTLRLFVGGEASGHPVSLWLLGFSSFFFLSLALVKRVSEMMTPGKGAASRRGYQADDVPVLQLMGLASGFTSVVVLSLFVQDEATSRLYASPTLLWCTVPLILFWLCRIWLSTARGYMHDDPIVYAAKDWVSWITVLFVFGALAAAKTLNGRPGSDTMNAGTLALTLLSVTISALGQISLKIGMSTPEVQQAMATSTLNLFSAAASSPAVLGGLMLYGMGALSWLLVLAKVDVNRAYPFVGIAIILTITIGHFFLREPLSTLRMMGALFVVAGIVLVAQN